MKSKAPLALMEQIVMLLVFALAAALCLQAFVKSDQISRESQARSNAACRIRRKRFVTAAAASSTPLWKRQSGREENTWKVRTKQKRNCRFHMIRNGIRRRKGNIC